LGAFEKLLHLSTAVIRGIESGKDVQILTSLVITLRIYCILLHFLHLPYLILLPKPRAALGH